MRFLLRLLGAVVLLLSAAVFVGCVSGIVGIWVLRQKASAKVEGLAAQVDPGLQRAAEAIQGVRRSVNTVHADVALVVQYPDDLDPGTGRNQLVVGYFRTVVQRLRSFSVAEATASSLLRSLQGLPLAEPGRIDPDKLDRAAERASQLAATLEKVQATLGDGDKEVTADEVVGAAKELDRSLQQCEATIDDWQADLDAIRAEVPQLQARILGWLTATAIAVTVVCGWVGVSQISLFAHGWRWCWGT